MNSNSNSSAETALQSATNHISELASNVEDTVKKTKAKLGELQSALVDKSKSAAKATDSYVHDNPWYAAGAALGIGFVVGLIIGRK